MDVKVEVSRVNIFLRSIASAEDELRNGIEIGNDLDFYTYATEWTNIMGMVEELLSKPQELGDDERKRLDELLQELESVKPIAEKHHLTWYRN